MTDKLKFIGQDEYKYQHKAVHYWIGCGTLRWPRTPKEWVICLYNIDIFVNNIPLIKTMIFCNVLSNLIVWRYFR